MGQWRYPLIINLGARWTYDELEAPAALPPGKPLRHPLNRRRASADLDVVEKRKRRSTDMRRLTTGIRSEKCVVRRFRRCAIVIECTYTNLDGIAYYTHSLYIAYCS
jgi:hypothetical protein